MQARLRFRSVHDITRAIALDPEALRARTNQICPECARQYSTRELCAIVTDVLCNVLHCGYAEATR